MRACYAFLSYAVSAIPKLPGIPEKGKWPKMKKQNEATPLAGAPSATTAAPAAAASWWRPRRSLSSIAITGCSNFATQYN